MGQEIHELRGVIGGDASGWLRAIGVAIRGADEFGRKWAQVASDVADVGGRLAAGITGAAAAMGTAVAVAGGKFNALKENATIAFSTILRDGSKAREFLGELQKFSQETPFSFGGLIKNSQYLLATGFALKEIIPTLRVLGDTMSGLGKGEDELKLVAAALGQIRNSAKLSAADMAQLTNQGIPAWQMLADAIGVTVGEARKMSESGAFSGQQAFDILMGGMQEKFGGGMAAAAGSFDQLLSNLKDTFDIKSGEIVAPLFNSLKNVFKMFLDYLSSGDFNNVVAMLTEKFGQAGIALERFIGGNKEAIIATITQAIAGLADGVANLLAWIQQAGPGLREYASAVFEIVKYIGQFIAQHPQVLVAFAVWQGAQMLGIVSAVRSFTSAVSMSIRMIWDMIAAMRAASAAKTSIEQIGGAVNMLKGALAAGAAAAIVAGFFLVLQNAAANLRAELGAVRAEADKIRGLNAKDVGSGVDRSMQEQDPAKRANALAVDRAKAEEEARLAAQDVENRRKEKNRVAADMSVGDTISSYLPEAIGGFDPVADAQKELDKAEQRRANAVAEQKRIAGLEAEARAQAEAQKNGSGAGGIGGGLAGGSPVGGEPMGEAAGGKAEEKAAAQAQAEYDRMMEDITQRTERFALKIQDLQTYMQPDQVAYLTDSMRTLNEAYFQGQISADQYQQAVSDLNRTADAAGNFTEKLQALEQTGKISEETVATLNAQMANLMAGYQSGAVTADGFARGISMLNSQMAEGERQAEAQARAEERKRLMSGQFTQEEMQTAYEDKIISMQRQRMQKMVDQQANAWAQANGFIDQTANHFTNLGSNMNRFGQGVQQATGFLHGMSSGGGGGFGALNALFSSPQNNYAMLYNELQQLKQILSLPGISMGRRAQVEGRMADIQAQLSAPPPPSTFVGLTGNGQIVDPGIQMAQSATRGPQTINVNLPNLTRVSQSEAAALVAALQNEMARTGRRL